MGTLLLEEYPDASSLRELMTGSPKDAQALEFIDQYREFLRSLGPLGGHRILDGRWARSIGYVYRTSHTDIAAAFCGLNFDECAIGMIHYVRVSTEFLHTLNKSVYEALSLGQPVEMDSQRFIGSKRAIDFDKYISGLIQLLSERDAYLYELANATSAEDCVSIFDAIAHHNCLAYVALNGSRANHLERITHGSARAHPKLCLLRDKDIDELTKCRAIPLHSTLAAVVESQLIAIQLFSAKMKYFGVALGRNGRRAFDDTSTHRILFCRPRLVSNGQVKLIARESINRGILHIISSKHFNGHLNFGRHTLISEFVLKDINPWLTKILSGHYRGQAEPFGDGLFIAPANALEELEQTLEKMFKPIPEKYKNRQVTHAIAMQELSGQLPALSSTGLRHSQSRANVLGPAFDHSSFLSIRIVDYLRMACLSKEGPSSTGANLLLNLVVINWILWPDISTVWHSKNAFEEVTKGCALAIWSRPNCSAEIKRVLETPTIEALVGVRVNLKVELASIWESACAELRIWLMSSLPTIKWPANPQAALEALCRLTDQWLRFNLPPFLLTASSPRLTSPTADRQSLLRLANTSASAIDTNEVLVFAPPKPRGSGNFRPKETPLQEAIDIVKKYAPRVIEKDEEGNEQTTTSNTTNHINSEATDWDRSNGILEDFKEINVSQHFPAATYKLWITREAQRWKGSLGDRLATSSMGTYTTGIKPALLILRATDDMRLWDEEWYEWLHYLKTTSRGKTKEARLLAFANRVTAAKRFVKRLMEEGYSIPLDLFDALEPSGDGMRRSATSTLLLKTDQQRVDALMRHHFQKFKMESRLADFYSKLHWHIAGRATEFGSIPLDCIDEFKRFVIALDKFSGLKSEHARRLLGQIEALVDEFQSISTAVQSAFPGSKYLFLFDQPDDWSFVVQLEKAFSRALSQVTHCDDARAHLTRQVSTFEFLFPGWEDICRRMLNGEATASDCYDFVNALDRSGFTHLITVLLKIGHGHSVTFIKYYLSIWDLLMSIYCRASLMKTEHQKMPAFRPAKEYENAFYRAQTRAGKAFNPSLWLAKKYIKKLKLKSFQEPLLSSTIRHTNSDKKDNRFATRLDLFQYAASRIIGLNEEAASLRFPIDSANALKMEGHIAEIDTEALIKGHQSPPSPRGRKSMADTVKSPMGQRILNKLDKSNAADLRSLADALDPRRTYNQRLPALDVLIKALLKYINCLIPDFGMLIQVGASQLTADSIARIQNSHTRLFVGPSDSRLGGRPRISIIDPKDPLNGVSRPRFTGVMRSAIAAHQLLRHFKEISNDH